MSSAVKQIVTNRIIDIIEQGNVLPWNQRNFELDKANYISKKPYSLLNQLSLYGTSDRFFLTKNQAKGLKGLLEPKHTKHMVTFWKIYEKDTGEVDSEGKAVIETTPVLRYYRIIGLSDIKGIDFKFDTDDNVHSEPIDSFIERTGAIVKANHKLVRAEYHLDSDTIETPPMSEFQGSDHYYAGLCRALVRWTANKAPSKRDPDDKESYGMESLIEELGSAMLRKAYGIEWEQESATAVKHWLDALKSDTSLIVTAASRAEKAVNFLKGTNNEDEDNIFDAVRGL